MLSWTWLWLQEKGFVVFMIATSLLVFSIFFLGMSTVTTLLGLLLPAYWSLQMLTSPLDSASATAMPLYWLLFTGAKRHNPLPLCCAREGGVTSDATLACVWQRCCSWRTWAWWATRAICRSTGRSSRRCWSSCGALRAPS